MMTNDSVSYGNSYISIKATVVADLCRRKIKCVEAASEEGIARVLDKYIRPQGWLSRLLRLRPLSTREEVRKAFDDGYFGFVDDLKYAHAKHHFDDLLDFLTIILELAERAVEQDGELATMDLSANDHLLIREKD